MKTHTLLRHFSRTQIALCLIGLFFYSVYAHAQQPYNDGGYWLFYFGDNKINDKIGIHSEAQLRSLGVSNSISSKFVRTGLNFYTSQTSMLTAGYGFFYNEPTREGVQGAIVREHRTWQQFLMRKKTNFVFMEHRYRIEQRFIENATYQTESTDHRLRYRFQAIVPFYTISPYLRYFFFATYNETMLNLKNESANVYDRNRLYAAIGIQISPMLNFQFGYLNQLASQPAFPNHEIQHLLQIGVSYNMDDLMKSFFTPIEK